MSETYQEYRARVLGYLGDRDPIRVLQSTPRKIERLLNGVPRRMLARRPNKRKWSVVEILAHLADAELAIGWRFRSMIATPGVQLQWWDEHLWSQKCHYSQMDPRCSLTLFQELRKSNLALLRSVPQRIWRSSYGVHEKRGRQTIAEFVTMEAAHDLNHLIQIERLTIPKHNTKQFTGVPARNRRIHRNREPKEQSL
jgi:hypothetical protein